MGRVRVVRFLANFQETAGLSWSSPFSAGAFGVAGRAIGGRGCKIEWDRIEGIADGVRPTVLWFKVRFSSWARSVKKAVKPELTGRGRDKAEGTGVIVGFRISPGMMVASSISDAAEGISGMGS